MVQRGLFGALSTLGKEQYELETETCPEAVPMPGCWRSWDRALTRGSPWCLSLGPDDALH